MQPTSFPVAPTTPDKDSVIFDLLGDGYAEAIIVATIPAPRSALDLVQSLGIPTAACYRRLAELCDIGLLAVEGRDPAVEEEDVSGCAHGLPPAARLTHASHRSRL